jgi:uncharacterized protein Yka (UPF0111/DUF47 family)
VTGTFETPHPHELDAYLEHLGSRLVFLIDWNRARKRLRKLAPKRIVLDVLAWAAANEHGHMAWLTLGGDELVFDALKLTTRTPHQLGVRLSDIIGANRAAELLRFTLQTCARGRLEGRSEFLVREEIRVELSRYVDTVHQGLLDTASEHASLVVELALAARDLAGTFVPAGDRDRLERLVGQAKGWEHAADALVSRARSTVAHMADRIAVAELLRVADDAADELEDAVFLVSLILEPPVESGLFASLQTLSALAASGAREYLKAVENARHIHRHSAREHMEDFLTAVDRIISIEHETDDALRRTMVHVLEFPDDVRKLTILLKVAEKLETATDALMAAALTLRDYVLGEVMTR